MNDNTYELFIGSNNETGKLEYDKIIKITLRHFDGMTISKADGAWKGGREKTAIVIVNATDNQIKKFAKELKSELKQEAIGIRETNELKFI